MQLVTTAFTLTFFFKDLFIIYFQVYECFAWTCVHVHVGVWLEES